MTTHTYTCSDIDMLRSHMQIPTPPSQLSTNIADRRKFISFLSTIWFTISTLWNEAIIKWLDCGELCRRWTHSRMSLRYIGHNPTPVLRMRGEAQVWPSDDTRIDRDTQSDPDGWRCTSCRHRAGSVARPGDPERYWWRGRSNLVSLRDVRPVESRRLCTHCRTTVV